MCVFIGGGGAILTLFFCHFCTLNVFVAFDLFLTCFVFLTCYTASIDCHMLLFCPTYFDDVFLSCVQAKQKAKESDDAIKGLAVPIDSVKTDRLKVITMTMTIITMTLTNFVKQTY